jgi:hypothetical protein
MAHAHVPSALQEFCASALTIVVRFVRVHLIRKLSIKRSNAAEVTRRGILTTTYRSRNGANTKCWCSRRESNPEPWD